MIVLYVLVLAALLFTAFKSMGDIEVDQELQDKLNKENEEYERKEAEKKLAKKK